MGNLLTIAVGFGIGVAVKQLQSRVHNDDLRVAIIHDNETYIPLDPLPPTDYLLSKPVTARFQTRLVRCLDNTMGMYSVSRNACLFPVAMTVLTQRDVLRNAIQNTKTINDEYARLATERLSILL